MAAGGIACPPDCWKLKMFNWYNFDERIKKAAEICGKFVTAPADVHATVEYRKGLTCRLLSKALLQAKERAGKGVSG